MRRLVTSRRTSLIGQNGPPTLPSGVPYPQRSHFLRGSAQAREEEEVMKYFKPELLARCRSRDDEVAEQRRTEWEEAVAAYQARFHAISTHLPDEVGPLCSRFSLHDAKMLGAAYGTEKAMFGVLLLLEGVSGYAGKVLELNYLPVQGQTAASSLGRTPPFRVFRTAMSGCYTTSSTSTRNTDSSLTHCY